MLMLINNTQTAIVLLALYLVLFSFSIATTSSKVYSVFSGKVSTVAFIPGMNNVIIINHGEYYTLYAKLKNLLVEKGDIITIGQNIAYIVTNSDGVSELQFQVWKNNIKLNPEKWIMNK